MWNRELVIGDGWGRESLRIVRRFSDEDGGVRFVFGIEGRRAVVAVL